MAIFAGGNLESIESCPVITVLLFLTVELFGVDLPLSFLIILFVLLLPSGSRRFGCPLFTQIPLAPNRI